MSFLRVYGSTKHQNLCIEDSRIFLLAKRASAEQKDLPAKGKAIRQQLKMAVSYWYHNSASDNIIVYI